jgi:hypothetical protein
MDNSHSRRICIPTLPQQPHVDGGTRGTWPMTIAQITTVGKCKAYKVKMIWAMDIENISLQGLQQGPTIQHIG